MNEESHNTKTLNISAALLLKSSLAQLVFKEKRKQKYTVTKRQLEGNKYAETVSKGLAQELRGTITTLDYRLYFCLDAIESHSIGVEIKMVDNMINFEQWYLNNSILQSVLYYTLLDKVKFLDTPTFRKKEGYEDVFYDLADKPIQSFELWFGDNDRYQIHKSKKVLDFYENKAKLFAEFVQLDWDEAMYEAKKFDSKHKFQEYYQLKDTFDCVKIQ